MSERKRGTERGILFQGENHRNARNRGNDADQRRAFCPPAICLPIVPHPSRNYPGAALGRVRQLATINWLRSRYVSILARFCPAIARIRASPDRLWYPMV